MVSRSTTAAVALALVTAACAHAPPRAATATRPAPPVGVHAAPPTDPPRGAPATEVASPAARATAVRAPHEHLPGVEFGLAVHEWEQDERVVRYVARLTGAWREEFVAQLERGARYESFIRRTLRDAGLPDDLHYLALVESGFDPDATSRVGAVGMWQFMAGTARDVGLRVDWWIDERRDLVRATQAAARNLRWLHSQFGSTLLAAAAYNGGETRVARGLTQLAADEHLRALDDLAPAVPSDALAPADDARYFALAAGDYLRAETKNYVPRLIATLLVAKEPSRYAVAVRPQREFTFDTVRVAPLTPLAVVAGAARISRDELLALNPQILRGVTPPGGATTVRVPSGSAARTTAALHDVDASDRVAFRSIVSRKRELLAGAAERAGVSVATLRRYNPQLALATSGKWKGRVIGGQQLRAPTRAVRAYARDVADYGGALGTLPLR